MTLRLIIIICAGLIMAACQSAALPPARIEVSTPSAQAIAPAVVQATMTSSPKPAVTGAISSQTTGDLALVLQPIVEGGLEHPTYLTHAGDGRLFVVEQPGRIRIIDKGLLLDRPFLDIADKVITNGDEQGLFSVAFSPGYKTDGQFFVDYTRKKDGATMIERYTVSKDDPNAADRSSAKAVLIIAQPEPNHNGGQLQFGPDGYLYIGMGDGGGQGDRHGPIGNGQNRKALLGKLLRIDVTGQDTYAIPATNPFGNEIWAYGLRNPWRFSFDRSTGDLYIADVGQDRYEEVDFQPASSKGGENYGWRIMEGLHCYDPQVGCDQAGLVLPIAEYSHDNGCAIIGGYVYRGSKYPALTGRYFFGDYCSGIMWSLLRDASGKWQMSKLLESGKLISSFGQGQDGELYLVDHHGAIYQLTTN